MIRKTTILFLALALLATVGAEESTTQEPTVVSKEKTPEPPKAAPETEAPPAADAGSNSDAAAPEAPADGGNGTSSSAFMSYGLGASVVLLAAL
ncbi:hypothetical protein GCK72_002728 [Caenorhabditis remanei]|nr:hypothetical protein GCK72_002728 [Caenorhabditis remanei]KAF1770904.1 hypothetical protein GCK72_002728 [Caenorhabditis remanei]